MRRGAPRVVTMRVRGAIVAVVKIPVLVGLVMVACGGPIKSAPIRKGIDTYPHEVDYELLGTTKAKVCASEEQLKSWRGSGPVGQGYLYDTAVYQALEYVRDADGLIEVRAFSQWEGANLCVTVTGRAYRVIGMRAMWGAGYDSRKASPNPRALPSLPSVGGE